MTNDFFVFGDNTPPVAPAARETSTPDTRETSTPDTPRRRRSSGGKVTRPEDIVRAPAETETLVPVTIRIPEQLAERLRTYAFVQRTAQQDVVRRALEEYFG